MNTVINDESARTKLIEIAARLTDDEARNGSTADWLHAFRKNYRHMAVTFGQSFSAVTLGIAESTTDAALEPKDATKAA